MGASWCRAGDEIAVHVGGGILLMHGGWLAWWAAQWKTRIAELSGEKKQGCAAGRGVPGCIIWVHGLPCGSYIGQLACGAGDGGALGTSLGGGGGLVGFGRVKLDERDDPNLGGRRGSASGMIYGLLWRGLRLRRQVPGPESGQYTS